MGSELTRQDRIMANKKEKGFSTDIRTEFLFAYAELGEAFDAWREGREEVGSELADAAIFIYSLAELTGHDLDAEIDAKMAVNEARVYRDGPNGFKVKDPEAS